MDKIAYFSNTDFSLYNFRLHLMEKMKEKNYQVFACAPFTDKKYKEKLEEKFTFKHFPLKRSIDFLGSDLFYFLKVFFFVRKEKPKICHNFTIKPCIYATLAQSLAKTEEIYCTVTGTGYAFKEKGLLQSLVVFLYKKAFKRVKKVIFQNPENRDLFVNLNIVKKEKTVVIKSSGVDTEYFKKETSKEGKKTTVTLISRMLYQKGIKEFKEAAENLKNENTEFLLVGPIDKENPSKIKREEIASWEKEGVLKYLGERDDIKEILEKTDIFVLPSFYNEGVPKVLLEAGSMELPLITTNTPGCREVVEENVNGFLVEPKNSKDLTEKIKKLLEDKVLRETMGKASREKIKEEFHQEKVTEETVKVYQRVESELQ